LINNKVFDTYRSAIALEAVDGGFIENVEVDSLQVLNTGNAVFLRIGERINGKKGQLKDIRVKNMSVEIAARKADSGYQYEGPIEHMPRNISPAIIIAGLPGALITNVSFSNVGVRHPGGGSSMFAKISLNQLDSVPEKAATYPEFSMFRELPAWAVYIRHASEIQFNSVRLSCTKKDYRTAVVLDDVHHSEFNLTAIKEPDHKKTFYQHNTTGVVVK
jgi:hypothetical protein